MLTEITDAQFEAAVASELSLVLFYKDKCPFCNAMKKIITKFSGMPAASGKAITYFQINRETSPAAVERLGVERIPSVFVFRNGAAVAQKSGDVTYRDLEKMIA